MDVSTIWFVAHAVVWGGLFVTFVTLYIVASAREKKRIVHRHELLDAIDQEADRLQDEAAAYRLHEIQWEEIAGVGWQDSAGHVWDMRRGARGVCSRCGADRIAVDIHYSRCPGRQARCPGH